MDYERPRVQQQIRIKTFPVRMSQRQQTQCDCSAVNSYLPLPPPFPPSRCVECRMIDGSGVYYTLVMVMVQYDDEMM